MHTNNIITLLKAQEKTLNARIRKTEKEKPSNQLIDMKISGMKLYSRILRNVCDTLWMMHLLKTSILITKTPLTTLKCLTRSMFKPNLVLLTLPSRFPVASQNNSSQRSLAFEISNKKIYGLN